MIPRRYAALGAVLTLALVLRLVFAAGRDRPLFSDEIDYDRLGETLAATGTYTEAGRPTAYRPVGYPGFVAAVYAAAGHDPGRIHVAQAVLGTASCALLFALAGGGAAGLWAAGIWAVYPPAILYTDLVLPETLYVFVLLAAVLAWRRSFGPTGGAGTALALGALLGALTLIKMQSILLLAALPMAAWTLGLKPARWGTVIAVTALVLLPWLVRNEARLGRLTLTTSVGANLLIGNNPFATGGYSPRIPPDMRPTAAEEAVAEEQALREAASYIVSHPLRFLNHGVLSLAHLAGTEGGMVVWGFHPSPGISKERLRVKMREVPVGNHLALSGAYAILLLTGILGLLAAPRDDLKAATLAILGSWLAVHFVFFGGSRFHFPLMPFLAVYAGRVIASTTSMPDAGLRLTKRAWAVFVVLAAGLLGVWAGEYWLVLRG